VYALIAGVFVALIGLFVDELRFLYDYAWFVGFAVAFVVYWIFMNKQNNSDTENEIQFHQKG